MKNNKTVNVFVLLFLCINSQVGNTIEASDAAKRMLSELTIRESDVPISADPNWKKPERIALLSQGGLRNMSPEILASLEAAADGAELIVVDNISEIGNPDVLLGACSGIGRHMTRLKWVQYFSAGVERCIDNPVFRDNGVLLTNMKGVYGPGIAEHVIAMMFSLSRGLHRFRTEQSKRHWNQALAREYPLQEIRGKTILVVGLGGIGTEIAWRAHALGMRVMATRNSSREKPKFVEYVGLADELSALASKADFIVNATPLTPSTNSLFDSGFFKVLKSSAYFINVGRGKAVVTKDLVEALKSNTLAGAALDVVEPEPLPLHHELWSMPNVIITPHISGRSDLVMNRFWVFIRENLRRYVAGEAILNVVNIEKGY